MEILCGYKALNAITIKVQFPIPIVDELLGELFGAGYHQPRLHPLDACKIAFRTHESHYEFLLLDFLMLRHCSKL